MNKQNIVLILVVGVLVLGGLYSFNIKSTPESSLSGSVLKVSSDEANGKYLVASNGMTLYSYSKDEVNVSNCYDTCAVNWPPYSVLENGPFNVENELEGQIATITRNDGSTQLTYNGAPLYFWKNDLKPGDTTGKNVGGVWFLVTI